ncbi:P-loop containing nucleoside triphosphate hydrolase protein [Amylocystis lapponica]|nr:P-loop containing nucleoside triphosphate hydrolase protein [Amylocystis lapponica]
MDQRRKDALKGTAMYVVTVLLDSPLNHPYSQKMRQHETSSQSLKNLRFALKDLEKDYEKTEDDIKAVQSVGQIIGEVMKQLDDERFIVKASSGPRYVVSYRPTLPVAKLKSGTRVSLDMTTLTIMRILPREVDPMVYKMSLEDPGGATFAGIGGLGEQVRELRHRAAVAQPRAVHTRRHQPPKGVLLYGPPGTAKHCSRGRCGNVQTNFLKVVSSAIVDKYIGESARVVREMFGYARDHEPCVIFMDEIDAIGGRVSPRARVRTARFSLLNQMDGFDSLGRTKLIMATNRPDTLDPALLRPGRLDRKIEVPLPNEQARLEILKIHAAPVNKGGESTMRLSSSFNGADLRNVVTEAGMFAIRDDREYVNQEDFTKAARKVGEAKKHESKLEYTA